MPTIYEPLWGSPVHTNQYSYTELFRTTQDMRIALSVVVLDEWLDDPDGSQVLLKIIAALMEREHAVA